MKRLLTHTEWVVLITLICMMSLVYVFMPSAQTKHEIGNWAVSEVGYLTQPVIVPTVSQGFAGRTQDQFGPYHLYRQGDTEVISGRASGLILDLRDSLWWHREYCPLHQREGYTIAERKPAQVAYVSDDQTP